MKWVENGIILKNST